MNSDINLELCSGNVARFEGFSKSQPEHLEDSCPLAFEIVGKNGT